jgi:hypothetical protein
MTTKPRKDVDWAAIENAYRAGIRSIRQIAHEHGVTDKAVRNRAKKFKWTRDLTPRVRQRAREMVRADSPQSSHARTAADDEAAVEQEATVAADVLRTHRKDIAQGRTLVIHMFGELHKENTQLDELQDTIIDETKGDRDGKRRNAMLKAISLPARAGVMRDLAGALSRLIPLERTAFSLDEEGSKDDLAAAILGLKHAP